MSQVSEIKCPGCGKWSEWTGKVDARCPHCGAYLEPGRFQHAEDLKVNLEKSRKSGFLVVKSTDDPIVRIFKEFVNWIRWTTFYGISVIYFIIAFMVIVYGLVMI
jgi:hypothetical protein